MVALAGMGGVVPLARLVLSQAEAREIFGETVLLSLFVIAIFSVPFFRWAHETINLAGKIPRTRIVRAFVTAAASCVAIVLFLRGAQADVVHLASKAVHAPRKLKSAVDGAETAGIHQDHLHLLPRFSARLTGAQQAPVGLVFLGSGLELLEAFVRAGWYAAERITLRTCLRAFYRGVLNRPYFDAPVLPAFLDGKLHDVAFQRTNDGGSSRRRHHARWWLTGLVCEGKQVWVATASYDAGVGISRLFPLPIHHIDPNIDAERDYIADSLATAGSARVVQQVRVTEPMTGRNSAGDHFYTGGMALVLA
jgi:LssY C-terminus